MNCKHLSWIRPVQPVATGCQECLHLGMSWVELRMCLTCGFVGCCNSSEGRHAQEHFETACHPLVRSFAQPGQNWVWCYADRTYIEPESVDQAVEAARRLRIRSRTALAMGAQPLHHRAYWLSDSH